MYICRSFLRYPGPRCLVASWKAGLAVRSLAAFPHSCILYQMPLVALVSLSVYRCRAIWNSSDGSYVRLAVNICRSEEAAGETGDIDRGIGVCTSKALMRHRCQVMNKPFAHNCIPCVCVCVCTRAHVHMCLNAPIQFCHSQSRNGERDIIFVGLNSLLKVYIYCTDSPSTHPKAVWLQ